MLDGISNPILGYSSFCAVKFVGYTGAAYVLSRSYHRDVSAWKVGAVRTLIGMVAGAGYFLLWYLFDKHALDTGEAFPYRYLAGLLPIRIGEWWLLIWLFYDRELRQIAKDWRMVGIGTVWSYVLDTPAVLGFFATAGVWVC
jgi:hypothetical protein